MKNQFVKCISQLLFLLLIIGVLPVYAQKKSKEKIYRLPDDLETLAGDPALLKKPEGLTVAAYAFLIIMLRLCIIKYILRAGLNII